MKNLAQAQNYRLLIFSIIITLICVVPFILISIYNVPAADDFSNVATNNRIDYLDRIYAKLTNGGGRLLSYIIVCSGFFKSFLYTKILPSIILILLLFSTYFLVSKSIFKQYKKIDRYLIALILFAVFLNIMPSTAEGIYWQPGSIAYTIGLMFINVFLGCYIQFRQDKSKKAYFYIAVLALIATIGTAEVNMIFIDMVLGSIFLYELVFHRKINKYTFILNAVGVVFSVLHILAPGNFKRADRVSNSKQGNFFESIQNSVTSFFTYSFEWILANPIYIFSILAVVTIIIKNKKEGKNVLGSKKLPTSNKISLIIFGFGILILTFLPTYFALGHIGPLRNLNCICYFFVIVWTYVLWLSTPKFIELIGISNESFKNFNSNLLYVLIVMFAFSLYFLNSNTKTVFTDLTSKKAYWYSEQIEWRINYLNKTEKRRVVVPELVYKPKSLVVNDIYNNPRAKVNRSYRKYFRKYQLNTDSTFVPNDEFLIEKNADLSVKILNGKNISFDDNEIKIKNHQKALILNGFAYSPGESCDLFSNAYIKIGNETINGKYGISVKKLKLDSAKPDCQKSGFRFKIPPRFLKEKTVFEIYLVDKFKINKYKKAINFSPAGG